MFARNVTWCIANLVRGKPVPKAKEIEAIIPMMAYILSSTHISETITDAMWALSYCSDTGPEIIPMIMQTGITQRIVEFCGQQNPQVIIPALRTIGNFVTGPDE
jgi:hypothetical protein